MNKRSSFSDSRFSAAWSGPGLWPLCRWELIPTTPQASMESHLMGFADEESRVAGGAMRPIVLDL
jgi:hypothetical protein